MRHLASMYHLNQRRLSSNNISQNYIQHNFGKHKTSPYVEIHPQSPNYLWPPKGESF